jgi:hypothetical protein
MVAGGAGDPTGLLSHAITVRASGLQIFSKDFQISACFVQTFPKIPLAVLWDFKGLQGLQIESVVPSFLSPKTSAQDRPRTPR